jgi:hypothetical protein
MSKLALQLKETLIANGRGYPVVAGEFSVNEADGIYTANTAFGILGIRKDQIEYPYILPDDMDLSTITPETHPWVLVLNQG